MTRRRPPDGTGEGPPTDRKPLNKLAAAQGTSSLHMVDQTGDDPPHAMVSDPRLVAWLDVDPKIAGANFMLAFWDAVVAGDHLERFDPKRVARLADDLDMCVLDNLPARTRELYAGYVQRVKAARLRAVCPTCGQVKP
jgi:hypothetical protein